MPIHQQPPNNQAGDPEETPLNDEMGFGPPGPRPTSPPFWRRGGIWVGLFFLGMVYLLVEWPEPKPESAVPWTHDYRQALVLAEQAKRPVLLKFHADWCGPCKVIDRQVFSDPRVGQMLKTWIAVAIDADANKDLAAKYRVQALPTLIVVTPAGEPINRTEGTMSVPQFAEFLAQSIQDPLPTP